MEVSIKKVFYQVFEKFGALVSFVFVMFPIVWITLTAFKNSSDTYSTNILFTPTLANFKTILGSPYNIAPLFVNSLVISLITAAIAIPLAIMAAYVFSRYSFPGSKLLLIYILTTQFIPPVVIAMPYFNIFRGLHLLDTKFSLVVVNLSVALPYAIWLLKGFVDALPEEIEEASLVDGCSQLQMLGRIVFPLVAPGAIVTAVFVFIMAWNDFLFAMILSRSEESKTLAMGLLNTLAQRGIEWENMSAIGLLVMVPIFILSLTIRKHFVQGLTMGGVK